VKFSNPSQASNRSGVAVIIVMISIFVLGSLAAAFALSMKVETRLAQRADTETEIQWLGRSGVDYCMWILAQQKSLPTEPYDALNQVWAGGSGGMGTSNSPLASVQREVQLGNGSFTWKITDMERKWNINTATEMILEHAMLLTGADAGDMTPVVNSILDWIDTDDQQRTQGTESGYYKNLDPSYEAKNGPIDDISELLLIRGISPEMYYGIAATNRMEATFQRKSNPFGKSQQTATATVGLVDLFAPVGTGKINLNTADASVLQVIPGIDENIAQAFVGARGGEDDGTGMSGPFRNITPNYLWTRVPGTSLEIARQIAQYCDIHSSTFQIEVTAKTGGSTRTFYAVVARNTPRDIKIISFYWKL
jgi:general secretion pathway protein K